MDLIDLLFGTDYPNQNTTKSASNVSTSSSQKKTTQNKPKQKKQPKIEETPIVSGEGVDGNQGGCVTNHDYVDAYSEQETDKKIELPEAIKASCNDNPFLEGMIVGEILNAPRFKKRW